MSTGLLLSAPREERVVNVETPWFESPRSFGLLCNGESVPGTSKRVLFSLCFNACPWAAVSLSFTSDLLNGLSIFILGNFWKCLKFNFFRQIEFSPRKENVLNPEKSSLVLLIFVPS